MSDVIARAKAQQLDFLKVEIETALTFAGLAKSKMAEPAAGVGRGEFPSA